MVNYKDLSITDLSTKWDNICLNILQLFNEVSERINDDTSHSDKEILELEALYDEISSTVDFDHVDDIVAYVQNEKS